LAIAAHLDLEERSALPFDRFQQQVRLSSIQERLLIHDYFQVERRDGRPLTPRRRLYKSNAGAVRVYIPKILVSGPHDAGKTTFVHAAAQRASSAEVRGTTVALDRGTVDIDGATVELYGTPGQSRFDPLLDTLAHQAVALVLVVDATRPEDDARAQDMAAALSHRGLTVVIAANKQDQPGARDPDAVAAAVAQGTYPAVGCIASDPESARHVLADLLDRLLHGRPDEDVPEVVAG
ncbi:MAG: ADP-ribosylation factor-like protein, partial [Thermoplasmatota archaeon]